MITQEQTKAVLKASYSFKTRICNLDAAIESIGKSSDASIYGDSVQQPMDGMPRSPQPGNKTANIAVNLDWADQRIAQYRLEKELVEAADYQVRNAISELSPKERYTVRQWIRPDMTWAAIAANGGDQFGIHTIQSYQNYLQTALRKTAELIVLPPETLQLVCGKKNKGA